MKNVLINIDGNYDAVEVTTNQLNELFKGTSFEAEHISTVLTLWAENRFY